MSDFWEERPAVEPEGKTTEVCVSFLINLAFPLHVKLTNMQSKGCECLLGLSSLVCNLAIGIMLRTAHPVLLTVSYMLPHGQHPRAATKTGSDKSSSLLASVPTRCLSGFCLCHHWAAKVLDWLGSCPPSNDSSAMAILWAYFQIMESQYYWVIAAAPPCFFFFHLLQTLVRPVWLWKDLCCSLRQEVWAEKDGRMETIYIMLERCGVHKAVLTGILMGIRGKRLEGTSALGFSGCLECIIAFLNTNR